MSERLDAVEKSLLEIKDLARKIHARIQSCTILFQDPCQILVLHFLLAKSMSSCSPALSYPKIYAKIQSFTIVSQNLFKAFFLHYVIQRSMPEFSPAPSYPKIYDKLQSCTILSQDPCQDLVLHYLIPRSMQGFGPAPLCFRDLCQALVLPALSHPKIHARIQSCTILFQDPCQTLVLPNLIPSPCQDLVLHYLILRSMPAFSPALPSHKIHVKLQSCTILSKDPCQGQSCAILTQDPCQDLVLHHCFSEIYAKLQSSLHYLILISMSGLVLHHLIRRSMPGFSPAPSYSKFHAELQSCTILTQDPSQDLVLHYLIPRSMPEFSPSLSYPKIYSKLQSEIGPAPLYTEIYMPNFSPAPSYSKIHARFSPAPS